MRVLITGIGGDIGQSISQIIRKEFPQWRICGCDTNTQNSGSQYVEKVYTIPRADVEGYLAEITKLIDVEQIGLCVPTSEAELDYFNRNQIRKIGGASLMMANATAIEIGLDKYKTNKFLGEIGIPVPLTVKADDDLSQVNFPVIFKSRRGAGSKINFLCENLSEASFYRNKYPGGIFQELLLPNDQELTCAVFALKNKEVRIIQLQRVLTGGYTSWAKVVYFEEVAKQCLQIAKSLDLIGSINVQLRLTKEGPRIFEINPRFSSTVLIRDLLGFKDLFWSLQDFLDDEINSFELAIGSVGVRTQGATLLPMQDCL